jgi:hypothetical protein
MSMKIRRNWNCDEKIKTLDNKYVYTILLLGVSVFVEKYIKIHKNILHTTH